MLLGEVYVVVFFEWELKFGILKRGRGSRRDGDIISDLIGVEEFELWSRLLSFERLFC